MRRGFGFIYPQRALANAGDEVHGPAFIDPFGQQDRLPINWADPFPLAPAHL